VSRIAWAQSYPARPVRIVVPVSSSSTSNQNPGTISMASGGSGSMSHVGGELFKLMTHIDMLHLPYRGGAPALTDLIGEQVQVMFSPLPESIETIKTRKVRALAVTTATRSRALPEVPTVAESVPGFEASTWQGIGAPKNTSGDIVDRLNKEINAALADPKIKARLTDLAVCQSRCRLRTSCGGEVGQGDPRGQDQAPVMPIFHIPFRKIGRSGRWRCPRRPGRARGKAA